MNEIEKSIATFIQDELMQDEDILLEAEDDLLSSGYVSSMAAMRIVQFVEELFGITVAPADLTIENFISVGAIGRYVEDRRAGS